MYPYDQTVNPPAPRVPVRISHPVTNFFAEAMGFLDTGASATVVPQEIINQLGLREVGANTLLGIERSPIVVANYQARLEVAWIRLGVLTVAGANFPHILLGRDVLNQFDITLRGKAQEVEMVPAR